MKFHNKKINLNWDGYYHIATFDDYDGSMIDNETPSRDPIGSGATEMAAVLDLIEQETQEFTDRQIIENAINQRKKEVELLLTIFKRNNDEDFLQFYRGQKMALNMTQMIIGGINK